MRLQVFLPTTTLVNTEIRRLYAEGGEGCFCLLPRHIDYVSALVPGILSYVDPEGQEHFLAVDEGILVKCGPEVRISVRNAVEGGRPGELRAAIEKVMDEREEQEKVARSALARLEAGMVRRFLELEHYGQ